MQRNCVYQSDGSFDICSPYGPALYATHELTGNRPHKVYVCYNTHVRHIIFNDYEKYLPENLEVDGIFPKFAKELNGKTGD